MIRGMKRQLIKRQPQKLKPQRKTERYKGKRDDVCAVCIQGGFLVKCDTCSFSMHPGCDKAMSTIVIQPQAQCICPFCRQDQPQNEVENMSNGNKETERKNGKRKMEKTTNI